MVWIEFLISAAIITFVSIQLAKYGDVIGLRTKLGGAFAGTLLLATATSLPEVITTISAVRTGIPQLAAGNLFGSNMLNILLLAILDLAHYRRRISRKNAEKHALSGSLAVLMIVLAIFFIIAQLPLQIKVGNFVVGADAMVMIAAYFLAMSLLRKQSRISSIPVRPEDIPEDVPPLRTAILWFVSAIVVLGFVTPWMVDASGRIAEITGLGATFIGSTLVAVVTSLPELITTISAAKIGADDMAIGNLFGSNMFNMFGLGIADFFFFGGRFFAVIDPSFLLIGVIGLLMTVFALIATLARLERRILFLEIDSLILILAYFGGLALLYARGIAP
jgi:cation:H+ antiporter